MRSYVESEDGPPGRLVVQAKELLDGNGASILRSLSAHQRPSASEDIDKIEPGNPSKCVANACRQLLHTSS